MITCSKCSTENIDGAKFCKSCGDATNNTLPSSTVCQSCAEPLAQGARFCKKCGHAVTLAIPETGQNDLAQKSVVLELDTETLTKLTVSVIPIAEMNPAGLAIDSASPLPSTEMATANINETEVAEGAELALSTPVVAETQSTGPTVQPAALAQGKTADELFAALSAQPQTDKPSALEKGDVSQAPVNLKALAAVICLIVLVLAGGTYWVMNKQAADQAVATINKTETEQNKTGIAPGAVGAAQQPGITAPANTNEQAPTVAIDPSSSQSLPQSSSQSASQPVLQANTEAGNTGNPALANTSVNPQLAIANDKASTASRLGNKAKRKNDEDDEDEEDEENENWANGRSSKQNRQHRTATSDFPGGSLMSNRTVAMLGRADDYINSRQYDKAISIIESALQSDPGNPAALAKLRKARAKQREAERNF